MSTEAYRKRGYRYVADLIAAAMKNPTGDEQLDAVVAEIHAAMAAAGAQPATSNAAQEGFTDPGKPTA